MRLRQAIVVGAGITGAAAALELRRHDWDVTVIEAQSWAGGNLRTATLNGVPYEPHGPHIFHTANRDVYDLVKPFLNDYQHHVKTTLPDGIRHLTWPLQLGELKELPEWPRIAAELDRRPGKPSAGDFEAYAVELMGPTLYEWFCEGYTWKQWGIEPRLLSARFAPKRLDLRTDGDTRMFRDPFQGYAPSGWHHIVEHLLGLADATITFGRMVTIDDLPDADGYVITAPLDQFLGATDPLPWRGVRTIATYHPNASRLLPAPVVNEPSIDQPHTRRVETRQMVAPDNDHTVGTVIATEYSGAPVKHYPVDDAAGVNRSRWRDLRYELTRRLPNAFPAGRLAQYTYIDMDQAIMQGLHAAQQLTKYVNTGTRME